MIIKPVGKGCSWWPTIFKTSPIQAAHRSMLKSEASINVDKSYTKCNTTIYSCLCGSLQESSQEGNGENDI